MDISARQSRGAVANHAGDSQQEIPSASSKSPTINVLSGGAFYFGNGGTIIQSPEKTRFDSDDSTRTVIDNIKKNYISRYSKHQIHSVRDNRIELREVNINDFTVKLKIAPEMPVEQTVTGETKRQFNFLKDTKSDEITLSQLIENNNRVTFIRGVAGMGKSTLAKQLVYGWADGRLYKEIKLCIMFECRDINHFQNRNDKRFNKQQIFEEFVKQKFHFNLGDGDGLLFVVDGLDELYDIITDDSLILPLLTRQIYSDAKIIITGRPHVESKLKGHGEIGGLKTLEIQGLSNEQIEEYVQKFPSPNGNTINLRNAIDASGRYFLILHIPQFLNTFCCVAVLERDVKINNAADLYSWTLYLFLKQHADKLQSTEKLIPDIFKKYTKELLSMSMICDNLLKSDKIILDADDSSPLKRWDTEHGFISGCFVDVSDNFYRRYQFKHITLMEFFAALHILGSDKVEKSIQEHLNSGLYQTVIFVCQLLVEYASGGIIKHLLSNIAKNTTKIRKTALLNSIITYLFNCSSKDLNVNAKLKLALEVLVCFLKEDAVDKESMLSSVKMLRSSNFAFSGEDCKRLCDIVGHLTNVFHCSEENIKSAFKDIGVRTFWANDLESLDCIKFLTNVEKVMLTSIKSTTVIALLKRFSTTSHKAVEIYNCTLEGEERKIKTCTSNINTLKLRWCKLDKQNFEHFCKWGISCRELQLENSQLNEERLENLLETMSEGYTAQSLKLKILKITGIDAKLSEGKKAKMKECGVDVYINGLKVTAGTSTPSALYQSMPLHSRTSTEFADSSPSPKAVTAPPRGYNPYIRKSISRQGINTLSTKFRPETQASLADSSSRPLVGKPTSKKSAVKYRSMDSLLTGEEIDYESDVEYKPSRNTQHTCWQKFLSWIARCCNCCRCHRTFKKGRKLVQVN